MTSFYWVGVYNGSGGVGQVVARRAHNPEAAGSSPAPVTRFAGRAGVARPFYLRALVYMGAHEWI